MEFKTTNTNTRVIINTAPYKKAIKLKNVLLNEVLKNPMGLKIKESAEIKNALEKELDFTGVLDFIKNILIGADISDEVNSALFDCLAYCLYDGTRKINEDLFDDEQYKEKIREDQYELFYKCIEVNLSPFIKSLASMWKTLSPKLGESQALNVILAQMSR